MSNVTPIEKKSPRHEFDVIYHELQEAIGDGKAIANLLTAVDKDDCNVNQAAFAQERVLERAEEILSKLWKFKPGNSRLKGSDA